MEKVCKNKDCGKKFADSLNKINVIRLLKEKNLFDEICRKSKIPRYYLETYGVNEYQLERLLWYV